MKAFIVVALLVASVAARSLDVDTLRLIKEKSLLSKDLVGDDLFLKEKLGHRFNLNKKTILGDYELTTPTEFDFEGPVTTGTWGQRQVTVLSLEEIVQTPLFREYYNIPLFRQFWEQYPTVFQRYVQSVLFQQFWTVPAFEQYFRNPVLFYKYIVPQVQVVARTQPIDNYYNKFETLNKEQYLNKDVYDVEGRDVVVGDYLNKIFNRYQGYNNEYTVPFARGYGQEIYGKNVYNNQVNYKFLLDKIYKTLFVNQPTGEIFQVKTDVKVAPEHKKFVVEPITGETKVVVEEPKIVDVKVTEKVIPRTEFEGQIVERDLVKETLLKHLLITEVITRETYEVLKTLPVSQIVQFIRQHVGVNKYYEVELLVKETLLKKLLLTKVITPEVYEVLKTFPITMIEKYIHVVLLGQDKIVDTENFLVKETLLKKYLLTKVITPEVYEVLKALPIQMVEKYIRHHVLGEQEIMETPYFQTRSRSENIFRGLDFPRTTFQSQTFGEDYLVKETLLKKLLWSDVITRETYEVLKTLPLYKVKEYIRQIGGQEIVGDLETPFVTRRDIVNPFVTRREYNNIFNTNTYGQKNMYNKLYNNIYNNEIIGDRVVPTLRELLNQRDIVRA